MRELHNKVNDENELIPKEGQRALLCSNKKSLRCPSLSITQPNKVTKEDALDYLASILVQAYLEYKKNAPNNKINFK